jgi:hypothetical protein
MGGIAATNPREITAAAVYYRSVQEVILPDVPGAFEAWGQPESLARMMRSYFTVAENCGARMVSVRWTGSRPTIFLTCTSLVMIGMGDTTFESSANRRAIHAAVTGGLLVMPGAQPHLVIALERLPEGRVHASVDLLNYQPRFGHSPVVRWVYSHTQIPVHVVVGRLYLRQLRQEWAVAHGDEAPQ